MNVLYLPFFLQGICILVDEFYFHEQRGLKAWEKVGHPLDTLTVVICYSYLLWGTGDLTTYIVLCALSCVFITKDEFVHSTACPAAEQWLHSLLFLLHPICFLCAYLLKLEGQVEFLRTQTIVVFIFMFYQALRWSYPWRMQTK
jgi:hypothetical protein